MRPATGQVIERQRGRDVMFAIRYRAPFGPKPRPYETLGLRTEGWTRKRAEDALADVLSDIRRGAWRPRDPDPEPQPQRVEPSFHAFATEWLEARRSEGLAERTIDDYEWSICCHLLPHFARMQLSAITVEEVDRYRRAKVAEAQHRRDAITAGRPLRDVDGRALRPLSPNSINKTLKHLAGILDQAVEYEWIARNPAKGKRRRLNAKRPRPVHVDGVDQLIALLDAARELDADPRRHSTGRYALVAR